MKNWKSTTLTENRSNYKYSRYLKIARLLVTHKQIRFALEVVFRFTFTVWENVLMFDSDVRKKEEEKKTTPTLIHNWIQFNSIQLKFLPRYFKHVLYVCVIDNKVWLMLRKKRGEKRKTENICV